MYNSYGEIDELALVQSQWGSANFLRNSTIMIQGLQPIYSITYNNLTDEFVTQPEFGFFIREQGKKQYEEEAKLSEK